MITAPQLVAHAVGDYVIQSDWMAVRKTSQWWPATIHAVTYAIPFVFLRPSLLALAVIVVTHLFIDRWRLARYVIWVSNFLAPRGTNSPWADCKITGFDDTRHHNTPWLTTWLLFIVDNILHVLINGAALTYL